MNFTIIYVITLLSLKYTIYVFSAVEWHFKILIIIFLTFSGTPQITEIDIFGGEPLGIFKTTEPNYGTKLDVWENLKKRELSLATAQPPANYFQKMILWTNQGKVWKFPIDNEQGT